MKRWSMAAVLGSLLLISLLSVGRGASSIDGNDVYYDGKITVTTKGVDNQKNMFDESTAFTEFKIEPWNVLPRTSWQGAASGTGSNADISVNDRLGTTMHSFGPKKVHFPEGLLGLSIQKQAGGTYLYSLQVAGPSIPVGSFLAPFIWMTGTCDTVGDDFLPLEIHGELTQSPWKNGVPTKVTWVLSRHIK